MKEFMSVAKALADESRVRVLMFLHGGELCVCQIVEMLGLAPSTVSKHMAVLHQAGLVESRKEGRWIYYRLPGMDAPACVREAIRWVHKCLEKDPQVLADAKRLGKVCKMSKEDLCLCYKD
ncbi:MAG: metalloregulator ArsR/SmtB family transcription factor [Planctomycetota bacterium]|nr:metalloregulator ArsR/SmtB family transcription factor [Planctomycetota bacterium]